MRNPNPMPLINMANYFEGRGLGLHIFFVRFQGGQKSDVQIRHHGGQVLGGDVRIRHPGGMTSAKKKGTKKRQPFFGLKKTPCRETSFLVGGHYVETVHLVGKAGVYRWLDMDLKGG